MNINERGTNGRAKVVCQYNGLFGIKHKTMLQKE